MTRTFCFVMVGLILLNIILFAMGTFQCSDILTFVFAEPPFFEVDNAWPLIINVGDI